MVVPGGGFLERGTKAGVYRKLDKAQLPNLKNLDPEADLGMAVYDPGNQYAVDYTWLTTTGIGYDVAKIKARLTDAPVDSWRMRYDPAVLARFQDCGVSVVDAPDDILSTVLFFLGKDPNSELSEDLKAAECVLLAVRPYVRYVDSTRYVEELANGELCVALGWSGDVTQARDRAKEAGKPVQLAYSIPKEGTVSIFRCARNSGRCAPCDQCAPVHQLSAAPRRRGQEFERDQVRKPSRGLDCPAEPGTQQRRRCLSAA